MRIVNPTGRALTLRQRHLVRIDWVHGLYSTYVLRPAPYLHRRRLAAIRPLLSRVEVRRGGVLLSSGVIQSVEYRALEGTVTLRS